MRICVPLLLLLSLNSFAEDCGLYYMSGHIRNVEDKLILVAAEHTQSEVKFYPHFTEEKEFVPFLDRHVTAEIIVREPFVSGASIRKIIKVQKSVPDLLNQNQKSVFRKSKKIACPEGPAIPKKIN